MSTLDAHRAAVDLCVYCPKLCRWACPVSEAEVRETVTPWALMTRVDDVGAGRAPLDGATGEIWSHCTGCGRCQTACVHRNDVTAVLFAGRAAAREAGVAPEGLAHWAQAAPSTLNVLAALPASGSDRVLAGHADDAAVAAALKLLAAVGLSEVGRPAGAGRRSGARALAAGDPAGAAAALAALQGAVGDAKRIICLEAEDAAHLQAAWPDGPQIEHLVDAVADRLPPLRPIMEGDVLYLDACRLGRGLGVYDAPRAALAQAISGAVEEATMNRAEGGCCGAGAGYAALHPEAAATVAREAAADVGAVPVVIVGSACARHLRAALAPRPVFQWAELIARALPGKEQS